MMDQTNDTSPPADSLADFVTSPEAIRAHPDMGVDSGRAFRGDRSIDSFADTAAAGYAEELRKQYPHLPDQHITERSQQVKEMARQRAKAHVIETMTKEAAPETGMASPTHWLRRLPFVGAVTDVGYYSKLKDAAERLQNNQASHEDYSRVAHHLAENANDEEKGFWSKALDATSSLPAVMAEWSLTGGAATAGRAAAMQGAKGIATRLSTGLVGKAVGLAGETAARTAAMSLPRIAAGAEQRQLPPELGGQGQGAGTALGTQTVSTLLENAIFSGTGFLGKQTDRTFVKKFANAMGTVLGNQELQSQLGLQPGTGMIGRLLNPETRGKAIEELGVDAVSMGILEGAMHASEAPHRRGLREAAAQQHKDETAKLAVMEVLRDWAERTGELAESDRPINTLRDWMKQPGEGPQLELPGEPREQPSSPTPAPTPKAAGPSDEALYRLRAATGGGALLAPDQKAAINESASATPAPTTEAAVSTPAPRTETPAAEGAAQPAPAAPAEGAEAPARPAGGEADTGAARGVEQANQEVVPSAGPVEGGEAARAEQPEAPRPPEPNRPEGSGATEPEPGPEGRPEPAAAQAVPPGEPEPVAERPKSRGLLERMRGKQPGEVKAIAQAADRKADLTKAINARGSTTKEVEYMVKKADKEAGVNSAESWAWWAERNTTWNPGDPRLQLGAILADERGKKPFDPGKPSPEAVPFESLPADVRTQVDQLVVEDQMRRAALNSDERHNPLRLRNMARMIWSRNGEKDLRAWMQELHDFHEEIKDLSPEERKAEYAKVNQDAHEIIAAANSERHNRENVSGVAGEAPGASEEHGAETPGAEGREAEVAAYPDVPEGQPGWQEPAHAEPEEGAVSHMLGGKSTGTRLPRQQKQGPSAPQQQGPPPPGPVPKGKEKVVTQDILDHMNAVEVRRNEVVRVALDKFRNFFQAHTEAAPDEPTRQARFLEWTNAIQNDQVHTLPAGDLRDSAHEVRRIWNEVEDDLLQRGILKSTIENYIRQAWQMEPNEPVEKLLQVVRSPLAGAESFKKQRYYPSFQAGIDAGRTPKSWNPIDIQLMGLQEAHKSIKAHDFYIEMKDRGLAKFNPLGKALPADFANITDPKARIFAPGVVEMMEFYDEKQTQALMDGARKLGVDVTTQMHGTPGMHIAGAKSQSGNAGTKPGRIERRFGTPEEVLAHEIGHELENRYGLYNLIAGADKGRASELRDLADERISGKSVSQNYQDYVREKPEQIANLIAAYIHTPELLSSVAPGAERVLDAFLQSKPELHWLRDVKPSLVLGSRNMDLRLAGPQFIGNLVMHKDAAPVLNNYLAEGLQGSKLYQTARGIGNFLNMFQLAGPGFHGAFSTVTAQVNDMIGVIQRASRLPALALKGNATPEDLAAIVHGLPGAVVPGWAITQQIRQGLEMGKEYYKPGSRSAETKQTVEGMEMAGGRARMDPFYGLNATDKFMKAQRQLRAAMKQGGSVATGEAAWNLAMNSIGALAQAINKPVLDGLVPWAKRGALAQRMTFERERLGQNASVDQLREAFGKHADSVDDLYGEVVYDNTHMKRGLKDTLMLALRSLGWNMGTWRQAQGGIRDIPDSVRGLFTGEGITDRTAAMIALPLVVGMLGSAIGYGITGEWPESWLDAFFPKTGTKRKDGSDDRLSLPSYMRDGTALFNRADEGGFRIIQNAGNMAASKLNPLAALIHETLIKNEDYYGKSIRDYNSSQLEQLTDTAAHIAGAVEPFFSRGIRQQMDQGSSLATALLPAIGITPAPAYVTRSSEQQRAIETKRRYIPTPQEKRRKEQKSRGLLAR